MATCEHNEAESEVLFLGAGRVVVIEAVALGTLSLSPWAGL